MLVSLHRAAKPAAKEHCAIRLVLKFDREEIMTAQATKNRAKPRWAGQDMRLDPARLPQAVSYAAPSNDDVTFTLSPRGAVMHRRQSETGQPLSIALPARCFRGVAARAIEDAEGNVTVTLELLHETEAYCVPLLVAHDLDQVAGDWHRWAEVFGLPMMLIEEDGVARTLEASLERYEERYIADLPEKRERSTAKYGAAARPGRLGVRLVIGGSTVIGDHN
jgi:hypothetical protein